MGGLDDILGGLMGGGGKGGAGGVQDMIGGLMGGGGGGGMGALVPVLGGLLAGGGLNKIMGGMKASGLSAQADSWVGTGENKAVSPGDIEKVVGKEEMQKIAQQLECRSPTPRRSPRRSPRSWTRSRRTASSRPSRDLDEAFVKIAKAGAAT